MPANNKNIHNKEPLKCECSSPLRDVTIFSFYSKGDKSRAEHNNIKIMPII